MDATVRAAALRELDLGPFFQPRRVAVIGASPTPGRANHSIWTKIRAWGEQAGAVVVPVTPSHREIDGVACVASVLDLAEPVDLAVILVGDAVGVFEEVVQHGARFAVIFGAGFAESGPEGEARQRRLEALVASGSTRLLGPNTNLNAFEPFRDDLAGPRIALITQSGHQGRPVYAAQEQGVALSHWVPTGNESDLEFADFTRWFTDQPEVGVIAAYIEGFKDGRTLMLAADHAARAGVPIVCVKVGRTDAGRSMAQSHTGHLGGADRVVDGVFRQFGITRVSGLDELTDTAAMFARTRRATPVGRGVCIYAISGGTGAHMADLCAGAGLELPPLAATTQATLRRWIPDELRVSNPVDSGGPPSMDERGARILDALLADPGVELIICPITGAVESISRPLATHLVAAAATSTKPVFVVWGSPDTDDPVYREILLPSNLPLFRTFANCVTAARAFFDRTDFQARYASPFATRPAVPRGAASARRRAAAILAGDGSATALDEHRSKQLLAAYGIRTTRDVLCTSAAAAARAHAELGGPVVMKVCSPDLLHKTDHDLVVVGVSTGRAARDTYAALLDQARRADPRATIHGVLVCEQIAGGVETVVGITPDPLFGPTVMFGLGGVHLEVYEDVAFRVPPFDADEARRMVDEVRGRVLLAGTRGRPPADVGALVDVIMKVQRLAVDHAGTLAELDINPLVVLPRGAIALDALAIRH